MKGSYMEVKKEAQCCSISPVCVLDVVKVDVKVVGARAEDIGMS